MDVNEKRHTLYKHIMYIIAISTYTNTASRTIPF